MPFSSMNLKNNRRKSTGNIDDFAIIKAAAWAWYERGSGSEGKPIREYDFTNLHRQPKPSRYKLEAITSKNNFDNESLLATTSTKSTRRSQLLDDYDIGKISKELDLYIESSRYGGVAGGDRNKQRRIAALPESEGGEVISKGKGKKMKWFRLGHAAVCGTRDDVVVDNFGRSRQRRMVAGKGDSGG